MLMLMLMPTLDPVVRNQGHLLDGEFFEDEFFFIDPS